MKNLLRTNHFELLFLHGENSKNVFSKVQSISNLLLETTHDVEDSSTPSGRNSVGTQTHKRNPIIVKSIFPAQLRT